MQSLENKKTFFRNFQVNDIIRRDAFIRFCKRPECFYLKAREDFQTMIISALFFDETKITQEMEIFFLLIFSSATSATGSLMLSTFQVVPTVESSFSLMVDNQTLKVNYTKKRVYVYPQSIGSGFISDLSGGFSTRNGLGLE